MYDTLRREWANKYSTVTTDVQKAATTQKSTVQLESGESDLHMGWALSKARSGCARFSMKVRQYLVAKFNYDQKTGKKCDPVQVATDMRKAKNQAGDRLFAREDWLTATQVKGFFSRLSKRFKGKIATLDQEVSTIELNIPEDEDDEEEKVEREILITEIEDQIQVTHPIFYDTFDLCEMYHKNQLLSFKVTMLKEICTYFDIKIKSKDKKSDIIKNLSVMIESCCCCD